MADIADEEFIEEFITFGVSVDSPAVLDKLRQFCQLHGLGAEDIACEWLAFNKSKKIPLLPDVDTMEQFERERLNKPGSKSRAKSGHAAQVMYTSDTLGIGEALAEHDMDRDDLVNQYVTPKSMSKKRQKLGETGSTKRLIDLNHSPQLVFSPRSLSSPCTAPSEKYKSRSNAGEVLVKLGPTDGAKWSRVQKKDLVISNYDPDVTLKECKYMFEKLCEKAYILSNQIQEMADHFKECHLVEEFSHVSIPQQGTLTVMGQIGCDGNGRLNSNSVILQGSREESYGRFIALDLSAVPQYSLFPGQLVAVEGTNANGTRFVVSKIYEGIELPLSTRPVLSQGDLSIVVACGPFTVSDNDLYEPLTDLFTYLEANRPDVCLLFGPFVDSTMFDSEQKLESTEMAFNEIFNQKMSEIVGFSQQLGISLVVLPSQRDVHHDWVYPQPPFAFTPTKDAIVHFMSDPCTLDIDGVVIGATSTDILFHMGAEEISNSHPMDRFSRLAKHILTQRCYYPLLPAGMDVNVDVELNDLHGRLPVTPHLLLLPSDLRYFVKNVGKTVCVNPGRLAKGQVGGTFARIVIRRPEATDGDLGSSVAAEILRV